MAWGDGRRTRMTIPVRLKRPARDDPGEGRQSLYDGDEKGSDTQGI
ncbi:hypothetical protein SAMN04488061_0988 [Filomicrobium insigne]|uniref:Transposase n=1 Tax=Filomicrobium insigne TaxID=418854 RepID=A0A1H0IXD5_9HYPH|nr:hypothetical protein SAMN04488061_0988 [Filomicrobium insigne]